MGLVKRAYEIGRKIAKHDRLFIALIFSCATFFGLLILGFLISQAIVSQRVYVTNEGWKCVPTKLEHKVFCDTQFDLPLTN
jgi:hypothetical protein